jgi:hypothetical protein
VSLIRQPGQKGFDLRPCHFGWMANAVKADEGATPENVSLLGTPAVVQQANALAQLVQNANGAKWWQGAADVCWAHFT